MTIHIRTVSAWRAIAFVGLLLTAGCGSSDSGTESAEPASPAAEKQPAAPFVPVDACSLLTKSEVEALAGKPVMEPRKETLANLVTCSYGDPDAPQIDGRAISQIVTIAVFTGQEGAYYAGPVAQAKDAYEMGRKNAASDEPVSGLGEGAYWDKLLRTLNAYKGKYWVSATVEAAGGIELAKKLTSQALDRLP